MDKRSQKTYPCLVERQTKRLFIAYYIITYVLWIIANWLSPYATVDGNSLLLGLAASLPTTLITILFFGIVHTALNAIEKWSEK